MMDIDRRTYLGGNCIGAIAGVLPWKNAMQVYLEKTGLVDLPDLDDNENVWWGKEMEAPMDKRYLKATGLMPVPVPFVRNGLFPWYAGHPDRRTKDKLVEYKTTGSRYRDDWGDPGTDEVPDYVATQCHWYMGLMPDVKAADVAVLFMGARREFIIYTLPRNKEITLSLIEMGRDFWENHIVPQIPPPIDGSEASSQYLKITYPQEQEPLIDADGEINIWAGHLAKAKEKYKSLNAELSEIENWLKNRIGDHAGIQGTWGKITWKKNKDSTWIDWKAAFDELTTEYEKHLDKTMPNTIKGKHTIIKPGARVFRPYFKEEK